MIKLIIKQGPFYISAFTALFLALANTGWLDRMFPVTEISTPLPQPMIGSAVECDENGVCTESFMLGDLDFSPASTPSEEWWFILLLLVGGTIFLGYITRKTWEVVFG